MYQQQELWIAHVNAVERNINEFITLITISQFSILITLITYKNTISVTLKMNERTHLPLVNMDWANWRIKPLLFFLFL